MEQGTMRQHHLIPSSLLLAVAACVQSQVPIEVSVPRSTEIILRTTALAACPPQSGCDWAPSGEPRRGILVFADADSLVMTDTKAGQRVTVWPGAGVLLEVYRGQRRTAEAVVKAAGGGALEGAAVGAGEVLLVAGLSKILGLKWDGFSLGESVKTGIVIGGAVGALSGKNRGMKEGEAVWERVTLLQLRQQLCRCAEPGAPKAEPTVRLIPER